MSQPWKLLPLAAIVVAFGTLLLAPGGATQPDAASAAIDCTDPKGVIQVSIRDANTNNPVGEAGIGVLITPDPQDNSGTRLYIDNGSNDGSNTVGQIREQNACAGDANNDYTAEIVSFPTNFECDPIIPSVTFGVASGQITAVELFVGNCETGATATPTGTITGTPGAAATVTTSASPGTISCSGTSIVTIQVRDSAGQPVPSGTAVTISTTLGSVSPSAGQTTDASGNAFVFLTAPANQGGTATVRAASGDAEGSTTVTINCGAEPTATSAPEATATTAPPPTTSPGVISPPSTGDAGLASGSSSQAWIALAASGMLAVMALGAMTAVRARA